LPRLHLRPLDLLRRQRGRARVPLPLPHVRVRGHEGRGQHLAPVRLHPLPLRHRDRQGPRQAHRRLHDQVRPRGRRALSKPAFRVLQAAAALCFVGHGAFGVITKAAWVPYFGVVGIGRETAYTMMPLIGLVDIALGLLVLLRPTRAGLAYMGGWAVWTALLRPLA